MRTKESRQINYAADTVMWRNNMAVSLEACRLCMSIVDRGQGTANYFLAFNELHKMDVAKGMCTLGFQERANTLAYTELVDGCGIPLETLYFWSSHDTNQRSLVSCQVTMILFLLIKMKVLVRPVCSLQLPPPDQSVHDCISSFAHASPSNSCPSDFAPSVVQTQQSRSRCGCHRPSPCDASARLSRR